jgi:hypothetical protein
MNKDSDLGSENKICAERGGIAVVDFRTDMIFTTTLDFITYF